MAKFNLFVEEEPKRYVVEVENRKGERTVVKQTNDYQSAVQTTNFWDERMNTYLTDRLAQRVSETVQERIDRRCDALLEGINARAFKIDAMITPARIPQFVVDTLPYRRF